MDSDTGLPSSEIPENSAGDAPCQEFEPAHSPPEKSAMHVAAAQESVMDEEPRSGTSKETTHSTAGVPQCMDLNNSSFDAAETLRESNTAVSKAAPVSSTDASSSCTIDAQNLMKILSGQLCVPGVPQEAMQMTEINGQKYLVVTVVSPNGPPKKVAVATAKFPNSSLASVEQPSTNPPSNFNSVTPLLKKLPAIKASSTPLKSLTSIFSSLTAISPVDNMLSDAPFVPVFMMSGHSSTGFPGAQPQQSMSANSNYHSLLPQKRKLDISAPTPARKIVVRAETKFITSMCSQTGMDARAPGTGSTTVTNLASLRRLEDQKIIRTLTNKLALRERQLKRLAEKTKSHAKTVYQRAITKKEEKIQEERQQEQKRLSPNLFEIYKRQSAMPNDPKKHKYSNNFMDFAFRLHRFSSKAYKFLNENGFGLPNNQKLADFQDSEVFKTLPCGQPEVDKPVKQQLTAEQKAYLKNEYDCGGKKPTRERQLEIAAHLELNVQKIKRWFGTQRLTDPTFEHVPDAKPRRVLPSLDRQPKKKKSSNELDSRNRIWTGAPRLTLEQRHVLTDSFAIDKWPTETQMADMANKIQTPISAIRYWFDKQRIDHGFFSSHDNQASTSTPQPHPIIIKSRQMTIKQREILRLAYMKSRRPTPEEIQKISQESILEEAIVQRWFRGRRNRDYQPGDSSAGEDDIYEDDPDQAPALIEQRKMMTPEQLTALTDVFNRNHNPSKDELIALCAQINLGLIRVRSWFLRERAKAEGKEWPFANPVRRKPRK